MKTQNQLLDEIADCQEEIEHLEVSNASLITDKEILTCNHTLLYQQYHDAKVQNVTEFCHSVALHRSLTSLIQLPSPRTQEQRRRMTMLLVSVDENDTATSTPQTYVTVPSDVTQDQILTPTSETSTTPLQDTSSLIPEIATTPDKQSLPRTSETANKPTLEQKSSASRSTAKAKSTLQTSTTFVRSHLIKHM